MSFLSRRVSEREKKKKNDREKNNNFSFFFWSCFSPVFFCSFFLFFLQGKKNRGREFFEKALVKESLLVRCAAKEARASRTSERERERETKNDFFFFFFDFSTRVVYA